MNEQEQLRGITDKELQTLYNEALILLALGILIETLTEDKELGKELRLRSLNLNRRS